ncbi:hypothetical protein BG004_003890 [Podila humilis]|nr:hypothetical protein BG004_003890 [Podila humilis]
MAPSIHSAAGDPSLQQFKAEDRKTLLVSLPTYANEDGMDRFILWSDIQQTFSDVGHLQLNSGQRIYFEVDENYNLYESLLSPVAIDRKPLRVKYSRRAYVVIPLKQIQPQELSDTSSMKSVELKKSRNVRSWFKRLGRKDNAVPTTTDPIVVLRSVFHEFILFNDQLQNPSGYDFLRAMATRNYYREQVYTRIREVEAINSLHPEIGAMRNDLSLLNHDFEELHQRSKIQILFDSSFHILDFPMPHLFIVLPTDETTWNERDPTTHAFRLYFLCDARSSMTSSLQPQHIHLSEHRGYDLARPGEFFQLFGQYALTILRMIKTGFSRSAYFVPDVKSSEVLRTCRGSSSCHSVTPKNIGALVDQAIMHLCTLRMDPLSWRVFLDPWQVRQIKSFLVIDEGEVSLANLHRTVYDAPGMPVRWLCPSHAFEYASTRALDLYVDIQEGSIDRQLGTIRLGQISSISQIQGFVSALNEAKHIFDVRLGFPEGLQRLELEKIVGLLTSSRIIVLTLDGITPITHSHKHNGNQEDVFVKAIASSTLQQIKLFNFPRPLEQYVYSGQADSSVHGLWFGNEVEAPEINWRGLWKAVKCSVLRLQNGPDVGQSDVNLSLFGAQHLNGVDLFEKNSNRWHGRLGTQDDVLTGYVEAIAPSVAPFEPALMHGALYRLKIQSQDDLLLGDYTLIHVNPGLRELEIPAQERNMLKQLEGILSKWHGSVEQLQVEFMETPPGAMERSLATLAIKNREPKGAAARCPKVKYEHQISEFTGYNIFSDIEVLGWHRDAVYGNMTDGDYAVFDLATRKFPITLTSFSLDALTLSKDGMNSVQNILQRTFPAHFHIQCVACNAWSTASLIGILSSVHWPSIVSLALTGTNIEDWLQLLAQVITWPVALPQLLRLTVRGSSAARPALSHSSALLVHQLIYNAKLLELQLENICLEDSQDWNLLNISS